MKRLLVFLTVIFIAGNCFAADLIIFSGAGLIKPMEEMRQNFEQINNIKADIHYGSSGELFALLAGGQPCDVLIPGAEKYTNDALKNGWIMKETIHKVVLHEPVIIVPQGNPSKIKSLMDFTTPGVRIALGDPKAPAIGKVAKQILEKNGIAEKVKPNVAVYTPTANQLLIYVALNQVDAAIEWGDMVTWAEGKGKLGIIHIPHEQNIMKTIPTAVTTRAQNKSLALKFNEYVYSEKGLKIWEKWGFERYKK